jgi:hypothetical protein
MKLKCNDSISESKISKKTNKKIKFKFGQLGLLKVTTLTTMKFEPTFPWGEKKGANHKVNFISSVLMWFAFALFM